MSSLSTYYGPSTIIRESGVWVADGTRRICIFYTYVTATGILMYAACVYRCTTCDCCEGPIEPTLEEMEAHTQTAGRRFEMRPVIFQSKPDMPYHEIIKTIRHEMCHGFGVKGRRGMSKLFYDECDGIDGRDGSDGSDGSDDIDGIDGSDVSKDKNLR